MSEMNLSDAIVTMRARLLDGQVDWTVAIVAALITAKTAELANELYFSDEETELARLYCQMCRDTLKETTDNGN